MLGLAAKLGFRTARDADPALVRIEREIGVRARIPDSRRWAARPAEFGL